MVSVTYSARIRATFLVIPDSVADPRLFLQAVAHPERFIPVPTFLAGLSSLTLYILERMNCGHIGHWPARTCDISYSERALVTCRWLQHVRVNAPATPEHQV